MRKNGRRGLATEEELKEFEEIVCEHMYFEYMVEKYGLVKVAESSLRSDDHDR